MTPNARSLYDAPWSPGPQSSSTVYSNLSPDDPLPAGMRSRTPPPPPQPSYIAMTAMGEADLGYYNPFRAEQQGFLGRGYGDGRDDVSVRAVRHDRRTSLEADFDDTPQGSTVHLVPNPTPFWRTDPERGGVGVDSDSPRRFSQDRTPLLATRSISVPPRDLMAPSPAPAPPELGQGEDAYVVSFGPNDPRHPFNWSPMKRWTILIVVCSGAVCVTVASSIQASTYGNLENEFGVKRVAAVAGVSLYVLGFGVGAMFLGPLSEFYGRSIIYLVSFALFTVFNIPIATAQNMGVLLFFRLITGLCGAGFLSVAGGTVSDLFRPGTTDLPTAIYTLAPLSGPCLGPILGGYMNQNVTWRATFYLIIAWGGVEFILLWFLVPETFLPMVLKKEARRLRLETGEGAWTSPSEKSGRKVGDVFPAALWVPIKLMLVEKMALALDIWTSLILGIIYLFFNAIPFTFRTLYSFNLGETGLAFFALGLGMVIGTATQPLFIRRIRDRGIRVGGKAPPEARLPVGMAGAVLAPVGLLWFALSSFRKMPWIMPMIGTLIFGVASVYIFTCVFGFLVATYPKYAASAMAGNTLLRCVWAAGFPLFALPMYQALGPEGATGLLAGACAVLAPIPFVLARVGPRLRAKSEYAS